MLLLLSLAVVIGGGFGIGLDTATVDDVKLVLVLIGDVAAAVIGAVVGAGAFASVAFFFLSGRPQTRPCDAGHASSASHA